MNKQKELDTLILEELQEIRKYLKLVHLCVKSPNVTIKHAATEDVTISNQSKHILKKDSELYQVQKILAKKGNPVHVNEIMEMLGNQDKNKKVSLVGSLNKYAKKRKVFTRTDRNTFGLIHLVNKYKKGA